VEWGLDIWTRIFTGNDLQKLIVRERDVAGQLAAEFAYGYARPREAVDQRHWVAALASYSDRDARHWLRVAILERLYRKAAAAHFSNYIQEA
jgi:hypothetical protein